MSIITIAAQKGGTGKTTTAAALAEAAAEEGRKVLAIDLDTGNLTFALAAEGGAGNSFDLINGTPAENVITESNIKNISVIPAGMDNSTIKSGPGSANRLKNALEPVKDRYDNIIIDTPAGAGELQYNGLLAADLVIIPLLAEGFSIQALYQMNNTIETIRKHNKKMKIAGIIANYRKGATLAKEAREEIIDGMQDLNIIYAGTVRTGAKIAEAMTLLQKSIYEHAPKSNPAEDYKKIFNTIKQIED